MNKKIILLGIWIFVVLILMMFSLPIEASEKKGVSKIVVKDQRITVKAIDSEELNFCGNLMGGFGAIYHGKTIRIIFVHGQIVAYLKGSSQDHYKLFCAEKLSFLNIPIDVVGHWEGKEDGVDQFEAQKIFIPKN